ncbi:hypothetical protein HZS_3458 [Henneguya salminicola]|nr:hypothetical protein HZS_3458 [Henneguya salminicola]
MNNYTKKRRNISAQYPNSTYFPNIIFHIKIGSLLIKDTFLLDNEDALNLILSSRPYWFRMGA